MAATRLPEAVAGDPRRLQWVMLLEEAKANVIAATDNLRECQATLHGIVCAAEADDMPQTEIGGTLGISRQRVNQIVLAGARPNSNHKKRDEVRL